MITARRAAERGVARFDWLDSRHTFSFGDYHDPRHMGFRALRVINEDVVAPGTGFPTHPHRDMEILTWVLDGALEHKDSLGTGSVIRPGEAQIMSAGTGIRHSEFNHSLTEPVHLLQIWILPERAGLLPRYDQRTIAGGGLRPVATHDGRDGSVPIFQDVRVLVARLGAGERVVEPLGPGRHGWVQVARGNLRLNGLAFAAGDGAALVDEPEIALVADGPAEALVFDLA
jgi:redox-sensitive bicupin YhaK (pirin superfamily)